MLVRRRDHRDRCGLTRTLIIGALRCFFASALRPLTLNVEQRLSLASELFVRFDALLIALDEGLQDIERVV